MRLRTIVILLAVVSVTWAFAGRLLADVIHLNTGGVIRGEIVEETEEEVHVKTLAGVTTVFREDIDRIERGKNTDEVYRRKLAALSGDDVDGHFELALWLKKVRMDKESRALLEKVVKLEPNHLGARMELGFVLRQGGWVTGDEAARIDKELLLVAPAEDASSDDADSVVAKKVPPTLRRTLKTLRRRAVSADHEKRKEAFAALTALPEEHADRVLSDWDERDEQGGSKGERPAREQVVQEARDAIDSVVGSLARATKRTHTRFLKVFSRSLSYLSRRDAEKHEKARTKLLDKWVGAKDVAIATIFDLKIYPDENHGRVGQPVVDEKVEVVEEAYGPYQKVLLDDLKPFTELKEEQASELLGRYEATLAIANDLREFLSSLGGEVPERAEQAHPARLALLSYRAGRISEAYAAKGKLTRWQVRLLERLRDIRIREHNDRLLALQKAPEKGVLPTGPEREQVRITNEYRLLQGREAVEIHPCLVKCARGHSNEMTRLGYFAHESPVAENRTPTMRAKNAGYESGVSENISQGSVAPQATHDSWYNSSGHHRNILGADHHCMGAGLDGDMWTQNFGGQRTFER
ncbi:CAP domain-containing protein [Planctomycetota bacterium]